MSNDPVAAKLFEEEPSESLLDNEDKDKDNEKSNDKDDDNKEHDDTKDNKAKKLEEEKGRHALELRKN